eukprot:TRINITY_DN19689_c0_g1_i1.p1 TRINITY_DN19689_c0_g1~~TRINITY_DN19689_c0_g1_i1.p1  ORF type:complete len:761 (+),score=187.87 TRINITY_DN19689_c0_g1_i1:80-2362(+)
MGCCSSSGVHARGQKRAADGTPVDVSEYIEEPNSIPAVESSAPAPTAEPVASGAAAAQAANFENAESKQRSADEAGVRQKDIDLVMQHQDMAMPNPQDPPEAAQEQLEADDAGGQAAIVKPKQKKPRKISHRGQEGSAVNRADTAPPTSRLRHADTTPLRPGAEAPVLQPASPPRRAPPPPERSETTGDNAGEAWSDFLDRSAARCKAAGVNDTATALWDSFRTSEDLGLTLASFSRLWQQAGGSSSSSSPPWVSGPDSAKRYPYETLRLLLGGNWKAKQLWTKLDARCTRKEYLAAPCSQLKAVVVGAGPCGLRAAIELRLLGASVTVLEKRETFTRINQLHLWNWCGEELKELGARSLEPPAQDFGANGDLLYIGISDLQTLLLKTALLFGVDVVLGADFRGYDFDAQSGGWRAHLRYAGEQGGADNRAGKGPSPVPPSVITGISVLLGAGGMGCKVGQSAGIEAAQVGGLRAEESAIGLVANFSTMPGGHERALRSFSMARQFYGPLFQDLAAQTGADLENIVYTKAKNSHYFVMTPTRKSLIEAGVVHDAAHKPLLARENQDPVALEAMVRSIAAFKFKPNEPTLAETAAKVAEVAGGDATVASTLKFADRGPQLFDFSKLHRSNEGLVFCEPPEAQAAGADAAGDSSLLVAVVGDALLEPFWPEGLGIVRGFFGALDTASAIAMWAGGASQEATKKHMEAAYTQLKTLAAQTRARTLRPEEKQYGLAPHTRYRFINAPSDSDAVVIRPRGHTTIA